MSATIILLVGTSSAGKSSLARELQAILSDHFLLLGIDDVFRMVSPRWGGGAAGPLSAVGFRYEHHPQDKYYPQEAVVTIRYGDVGRAIINGMHRAVAAFAQSGTNVIVDDMLLDHWVINDWAYSLSAYRTYIVKVHAPLPILEEREVSRRNPKGLSRGHYAINDIPVFDYCIDTARVSPREGAEELFSWLNEGPLPNAVRYYEREKENDGPSVAL